MRCAVCQAENRPGVRFCEECGARLEATCPACGARVPPDKKFCGECGAALTTQPSSTAATTTTGLGGLPGPSTPDRASPRAYTPAHLAERILRERSALSGERKQVTVLFADVSGFTGISERLDPEEVHALINRAFELMLAEIHRYEGTVNQFLGDGLMALFGAPVAHEDHARRAAHAALGMERALTGYRDETLRRGIDFRVRMGLNTGLVVVGAIGDNLRMDYTAVGDTTNTAARMQQRAEPGQIVVAEATQRLIAPYFETDPLGTFPVKGRSQPVAAYGLTRDKGPVSRLAARAAHGLSPFVGRDDAIATLERAWAAARGGRGQVVFVVGDAGIGKSRLLLEFRRRVGEAATWLEGGCVSFGQSTPFLPILEMLKQNFRIQDQDVEAEIVAKIEHGVGGLGTETAGIAPYLRYLLSVDPGDPTVVAMDAVQRREKIVAAIQRLTAAGSRRRPSIFVIEDAQWIDPASEDYLKAFTESLPGMAVLFIVAYRPVYQHPFGDRTYYWRIALQPIDEDDAGRIVRATLAVGALPRELAGAIARKAEGNPFFLEEIGRTLTETGMVRVENGRLVEAQSAAALTVPDTVQDVIAARIDRLENTQKQTVQTASVIGREFALRLLRRVSDVHEQLEPSLAELKRLELIYEKMEHGDPAYVFRHALTQDVVYASLLQSERRRLHALIGAAIEDTYAGRLDERTEALAYHFTRGEVWDKVVRYAREAGDRAAALFVDAKAIEFYALALDALRRLPETAETARVALDIRFAMRAPLWRSGQLEPLFTLFKEAEGLATRYGETDRLDTIYAFLVQYHWAKGEQEQAIEYGRRCLETAAARDDLALRVTGHFYLSHAYEALGQFAAALEHAREIISSLEGPRETERFGLSGLPYCGACALGAEALSQLGDSDGARELIGRGERVADAVNHLYSKMVLAVAHGFVLVDREAVADAIGVLEPTVTICREKNFVGQLMRGLTGLGHAYALTGRTTEGIALAKEAVALQERAGAFVNRGRWLFTLAWAYAEAGRLDEAEETARGALGFAERHGERWVEGWCRYVLGEIASRRGDSVAAAESFDDAQEIAEELAMRPLLERCRAGVARLRRQGGGSG